MGGNKIKLCTFVNMLDQYKRFADRYFETLNGTQSAIYAGYSEASARQEASRLLDREDIQEYLQVLRDAAAEKTGITAARVLQEIGRLAFADIRNYYRGDNQLIPVCDLDDDAAAALAGLKTFEEFTPDGDPIGTSKEIKLYDKLAGLEKLARHLGLYEKDNGQKEIGIHLHFDHQDEQLGADVQKD